MKISCTDCKHHTSIMLMDCCKLKMRVIRGVKETEYVECEIMRKDNSDFLSVTPLCGPEANLFEKRS